MDKVTNEVLLEKIASSHDITYIEIKGIKENLGKLNGQVVDNTKFVAGQRIKNREYDKGMKNVNSLTKTITKWGAYVTIVGGLIVAFKDKIVEFLSK